MWGTQAWAIVQRWGDVVPLLVALVAVYDRAGSEGEGCCQSRIVCYTPVYSERKEYTQALMLLEIETVGVTGTA